MGGIWGGMITTNRSTSRFLNRVQLWRYFIDEGFYKIRIGVIDGKLGTQCLMDGYLPLLVSKFKLYHYPSSATEKSDIWTIQAVDF